MYDYDVRILVYNHIYHGAKLVDGERKRVNFLIDELVVTVLH